MSKTIFSSGGGSMNSTVLDKAEGAISKGDFDALAAAATEIGSLLGRGRNSYLVEPLIVIADHLAKNPDYHPHAIEAYNNVADKAPRGSEFTLRSKDSSLELLRAQLETEYFIPSSPEAKKFVKRFTIAPRR